MRKHPLRVVFIGGTLPRYAGLLASFSPAIHPLPCRSWAEVDLWGDTDLVVALPGSDPEPPQAFPVVHLVETDFDSGSAVIEARLLSDREPQGKGPETRLLGVSPEMARIRGVLRTMAKTSLPLLLGGENGTGKDLAAGVVHEISRRSGPFVAVNCAAVPTNLAETEFFGCVRGAFTGAENRTGYCQQALGGTLFLDEVGELPLEIQATLLRVLENHELRRVGSPRMESTDFRLVCASHRDLAAEVVAGRFREDLYYRVQVLSVKLPALRERKEDIPLLAHHFLEVDASLLGRQVRPGPSALAKLSEFHWPGNLRQLRNVLLRAAVLEAGPELGADSLSWDDWS